MQNTTCYHSLVLTTEYYYCYRLGQPLILPASTALLVYNPRLLASATDRTGPSNDPIPCRTDPRPIMLFATSP
jgi:hypothetical protein